MLVHLPDGYQPEHAAPALAEQLETLPAPLRRNLGPGLGMRDWKNVSAATGIDIYFCDAHAPGNAGPTRTRTAHSVSTSSSRALRQFRWRPLPPGSQRGNGQRTPGGLQPWSGRRGARCDRTHNLAQRSFQ